jgi:hypothetical protein
MVARGGASADGMGPQRTEERRPSGVDGVAEGAAASTHDSRRRRLSGRRGATVDGARLEEAPVMVALAGWRQCASREAAAWEMGGRRWLAEAGGGGTGRAAAAILTGGRRVERKRGEGHASLGRPGAGVGKF